MYNEMHAHTSVVRKETPQIHHVMMWLSSTPVMAIQTLPATSFPFIKLRQHVKSACTEQQPILRS
jgi:hypothetical protein